MCTRAPSRTAPRVFPVPQRHGSRLHGPTVSFPTTFSLFPLDCMPPRRRYARHATPYSPCRRSTGYARDAEFAKSPPLNSVERTWRTRKRSLRRAPRVPGERDMLPSSHRTRVRPREIREHRVQAPSHASISVNAYPQTVSHTSTRRQ